MPWELLSVARRAGREPAPLWRLSTAPFGHGSVQLLRFHGWEEFREQRRRKFLVVVSAICCSETPRRAASLRTVSIMNAGSLRLPRLGTGARYGASVSISRRSVGVMMADCWISNAFG